jgi:UDP-N-acetylglucosamine 2-epimerase (non-hydrolysing)
MHKILFVFGTRPEAVKLCPVLLHLRHSTRNLEVKVCVTAQHRSMLDQVLAVFEVKPDHDLDVMQPAQTLAQSTGRMMAALDPVIKTERPDMVIVQGDTTTTLCGALAAFYNRVPVAHVEAGLRTWDPWRPFPEEMNRVLTARMTDLHFASTTGAARNLENEGVERTRIHVTGNSGIDAVLHVKNGLERGALQGVEWPQLDRSRKLIVVTAHRRESFGNGFDNICAALARLAQRDDIQIVYPVHRNPNVLDPVHRKLGHLENVFLVPPLDYVPFVDLMRRAYILISDSGGVQEEAPSLGKPILVLRDKTERPEAVDAATARLVGTHPSRIIREATLLLDDAEEYSRCARVHNPYGDGRASSRIGDAIHSFFEAKSPKSSFTNALVR